MKIKNAVHKQAHFFQYPPCEVGETKASLVQFKPINITSWMDNTLNVFIFFFVSFYFFHVLNIFRLLMC